MLKRTVTGAVYVAVIAGFFILREFADVRVFSALIMFFCALGTFEIARAVKEKLARGVFSLAVVFGILFVPIYFLFNYVVNFLDGGKAALILCGAFFILALILSLAGRTENTGVAFNLLPFIYPSLLLLTTLLTNDLERNSLVALILIFAIPSFSDTFAYLVGMTYNKIRKGKAKKLCPNLSPKKTWAGAIGGVVGGIVAAVLAFYIFGYYSEKFAGILPFMIIGGLSAVVTELGDLFESLIKRKVGLKDMGNVMPGHGGIMDRIDGLTFASAFIYLAFFVI